MMRVRGTALNLNRFLVPSVNADGTPAAGRLDIQDLRSVFELLREVQLHGDEPLQWRAHAIRRLCEMTKSQRGWMSHEIAEDNHHRVMILGCRGSSTTVSHCEGHAHPPIERYFRSKATVDESVGDCPVVKMLVNVGSECHVIASHISLLDADEKTNIAIGRSKDQPMFASRHKQILRLFMVELTHMIRRDNPGTFGDPLQAFSPRLREVSRLLALGKTEEQTASLLGIGRHTVHRYVMDIYRKLKVSSRAEFLVAMGAMPQLTPPKISLDWPEETQNQE